MAIFVLVVALALQRSDRAAYIWSAWIFWIFYTLIGFVKPSGVTEENFRLMIQAIGKSWISLIAIPWIAFRVVSRISCRVYTNLLVYTVAFGSILSFLQLWNPSLFIYVRGDSSLRAGGTWLNANLAGLVFMLTLSLIHLGNWPHRWVKWLLYLIILAGLIATFSRGAIV